MPKCPWRLLSRYPTFVSSITTSFIHNLNLNSIMLPWFIYLILQFGFIGTPEQWNTLTPQEKNSLEIIVDTLGMG
jgi:hypothetical protein